MLFVVESECVAGELYVKGIQVISFSTKHTIFEGRVKTDWLEVRVMCLVHAYMWSVFLPVSWHKDPAHRVRLVQCISCWIGQSLSY